MRLQFKYKVLITISVVLAIISIAISIAAIAISASVYFNTNESTEDETVESIEEDSRYKVFVQKDKHNNVIIREIVDTETGITTKYVFRYTRNMNGDQCEGYSVVIFDKDGNILEKISN